MTPVHCNLLRYLPAPFSSVSRRTQDIRQAVVSFVTFALHDRLFVVHGQRHRERPGARPRRRIVDGDRPDNLIRRDARELLDELQRPSIGVAIDTAILEIRGLHDERLAVPMATGIAHIQVNAFADVRTVFQRNHARLVNHLVLIATKPCP